MLLDGRLRRRVGIAHQYSRTRSRSIWGTTDAKGQTSLEITLEPAVLLVVYKNRLYSFPANAFDTERTLRLK